MVLSRKNKTNKNKSNMETIILSLLDWTLLALGTNGQIPFFTHTYLNKFQIF